MYACVSDSRWAWEGSVGGKRYKRNPGVWSVLTEIKLDEKWDETELCDLIITIVDYNSRCAGEEWPIADWALVQTEKLEHILGNFHSMGSPVGD